jgi:tRNA-splicing ligase RtcB (3'-phosphate/5'-hydroxy nucleic acid ligase)
MRTKQLTEMGVPDSLLPIAIEAVQLLSAAKHRGREIKVSLAACIANPESFQSDPSLQRLAAALIEENKEPAYPARDPVTYQTWGTEIDDVSHHQMREACKLPMAVGAALMPDAHVGYGLPIGGVLALENAVVPYAVGVDIACRMKLSIVDATPEELADQFRRFKTAIENGTRFGVGAAYKTPQDHAVMDQDWSVSRITREHKDKARKQLGTSGSGNHFVEFGVLTVSSHSPELGLLPGKYVALMSHSGSRGTGAAVCSTYSAIAQSRLPKRYQQFGKLAWLDLESEAGQEYWNAMNLMGDYAAANHDVIHKLVTKLAKTSIIAGVENHHNFAWKEKHLGRELIVHRKGATPAGHGVLGVIPGSMATPAFVVRGRGNDASFHSAAHGAGRLMSRTKARDQFSFRPIQKDLLNKGVHVLSAGADEVPYVYKNIHEVMSAQQDLVEIIAQFDPKIVKMSDDGKSED